MKKAYKDIQDEELRGLYQYAIGKLEKNLCELLPFYSEAPQVSDYHKSETPFFAGNLLGLAKSAVRSYAASITETASHKLREVLTAQLNRYIRLHYKVFQYMYRRGYYPA